MSGAMLDNPEALRLLWAVPVLALCFVYASRKRAEALRVFAQAGMARHLLDATLGVRRAWKSIAVCLAFAALAVALAGPAWNPRPVEMRREGRDVVFLLDVSRSMLAQDLTPSRLERAKAAIIDCVPHLHGDRVALVAFAGETVIQCPLTMDYAFFRMRVEDTDPSVVSVGGTRIGDALNVIIDKVLAKDREGRQDIVLITDGEDHESDPAAAARALDRAGARLIALGIGDDQRGRRVPVRDEATGLESYLTHGNQEVWTRLDAATLRAMVHATRNGVYLHVATGTIDLPAVYKQLILSEQGRSFQDQTLLRYEEKFQVFLGLALLLLLLAVGTGDLRRGSSAIGRRIWKGPGVAALLAMALLLETPVVVAESAAALVTKGNREYNAQNFESAAVLYNEALGASPDAPITHYNLGNALYRRGDLEQAMEAYDTALYLTEDSALAARALHNLGNCVYNMAELQQGMDLGVAADLCRMSARYFRAALDADPSRRESAINLELARRTAAELDAQRAEADDLRKQLQDALKEIIDILKNLIARQEALVQRTDTMDPADAIAEAPVFTALGTDQRGVRTDTQALLGRMEEVELLFPPLPSLPKDAPPEMVSPLSAPIRHVKTAVAAQDEALARLAQRTLAPARAAMREAVAALRRALEAMPVPQQSDENQGDPSDEESSEEEEYEESEEQGDQQADQVKPEQPPEDEEFTAPKEAPEDILEEEQRNNLMRQQKRPGGLQVVEKDW